MPSPPFSYQSVSLSLILSCVNSSQKAEFIHFVAAVTSQVARANRFSALSFSNLPHEVKVRWHPLRATCVHTMYDGVVSKDNVSGLM